MQVQEVESLLLFSVFLSVNANAYKTFNLSPAGRNALQNASRTYLTVVHLLLAPLAPPWPDASEYKINICPPYMFVTYRFGSMFLLTLPTSTSSSTFILCVFQIMLFVVEDILWFYAWQNVKYYYKVCSGKAKWWRTSNRQMYTICMYIYICIFFNGFCAVFTSWNGF